MPTTKRVCGHRRLRGDRLAMSSAQRPAKRDHHTQEKQNPPGNMIFLHISFCSNDFVLSPFNSLDVQKQCCWVNLLFAWIHQPKAPPAPTSAPSICIYYMNLKKDKKPTIPQDISQFNFMVSITHSYFGKAQGNSRLLVTLPLEPASIPPQPNARSFQCHTMCCDPLVKPKPESPG